MASAMASMPLQAATTPVLFVSYEVRAVVLRPLPIDRSWVLSRRAPRRR